MRVSKKEQDMKWEQVKKWAYWRRSAHPAQVSLLETGLRTQKKMAQPVRVNQSTCQWRPALRLSDQEDKDFWKIDKVFEMIVLAKTLSQTTISLPVKCLHWPWVGLMVLEQFYFPRRSWGKSNLPSCHQVNLTTIKCCFTGREYTIDIKKLEFEFKGVKLEFYSFEFSSPNTVNSR